MELLNSTKNLEDIRDFLFNMASYVLDYDVTFKDGQTCELSEDEKILIRFSKGEFVEGDTFKLDYLWTEEEQPLTAPLQYAGVRAFASAIFQRGKLFVGACHNLLSI